VTAIHSALHGRTVSILGGTGPQGRGLARCFAAAGSSVVIGSRSAQRAEETAIAIATTTGGLVPGASNEHAARAGDTVVVTVPREGHGGLLKELEAELVGKIVVDCVNPLGFDKKGAYALQVKEGSAAQQAAAILPRARVVAAFHHVSAVQLNDRRSSRLAPTCWSLVRIGRPRSSFNCLPTPYQA